MKKKYIGTSFDDYLKEQGIYESTTTAAAKQILSFQIRQEMQKKHLSKSEMTRRMNIKNRALLDRLLDPHNASVTLLTLEKAATALGKTLQIKFV